MTDKKYECKNDTNLAYCSLSNDEYLRSYCAKYDKMLKFIKEFHANPSDTFIARARDLLKEIGELK